MVSAAARLFSERGYHGTSMQDVAGALGLLRRLALRPHRLQGGAALRRRRTGA